MFCDIEGGGGGVGFCLFGNFGVIVGDIGDMVMVIMGFLILFVLYFGVGNCWVDNGDIIGNELEGLEVFLIGGFWLFFFFNLFFIWDIFCFILILICGIVCLFGCIG